MSEQEPTQPRRRFSDLCGECETVVGPDVSITGEIRGTSNIEFCGVIDGTLEIDGFLWLRAGGRVDGRLKVTSAVIEGEVSGDIVAREKLELRSSCRVHGDISAAALAIAEGGYFEGTITMAGRPSQRGDLTFQEKRQTDE